MSVSDAGGTETSTTDRMQAAAHDLGDDVERRAARAAETSKAKLSEQLDRGTSQVGSQARSLATTLRRSSEQLGSERDANEAARLSRGVADQLERVGRYLEQRRGSELLDDAEHFARTRPWVVAGAAAVAGLLASRLLKASSEHRYVRSSRGATWPRPPVDRAQLGSAEREAPLASGV